MTIETIRTPNLDARKSVPYARSPRPATNEERAAACKPAHGPMPAPRELAPSQRAHLYAFSFVDFERGMLRAVQHGGFDGVLGPADWVIYATSEEEAMWLARRAAFRVWPQPERRHWSDFEVEFWTDGEREGGTAQAAHYTQILNESLASDS